MTISEIRAINREKGFYFFSRDTMEFFKSKVFPDVFSAYERSYFITSEKACFDNPTRVYKVRVFNQVNGDVRSADRETYPTVGQARKAARQHCLNNTDRETE